MFASLHESGDLGVFGKGGNRDTVEHAGDSLALPPKGPDFHPDVVAASSRSGKENEGFRRVRRCAPNHIVVVITMIDVKGVEEWGSSRSAKVISDLGCNPRVMGGVG
jgi:hypothetical protein